MSNTVEDKVAERADDEDESGKRADDKDAAKRADVEDEAPRLADHARRIKVHADKIIEEVGACPANGATRRKRESREKLREKGLVEPKLGCTIPEASVPPLKKVAALLNGLSPGNRGLEDVIEDLNFIANRGAAGEFGVVAKMEVDVANTVERLEAMVRAKEAELAMAHSEAQYDRARIERLEDTLKASADLLRTTNEELATTSASAEADRFRIGELEADLERFATEVFLRERQLAEARRMQADADRVRIKGLEAKSAILDRIENANGIFARLAREALFQMLLWTPEDGFAVAGAKIKERPGLKPGAASVPRMGPATGPGAHSTSSKAQASTAPRKPSVPAAPTEKSITASIIRMFKPGR